MKLNCRKAPEYGRCFELSFFTKNKQSGKMLQTDTFYWYVIGECVCLATTQSNTAC